MIDSTFCTGCNTYILGNFCHICNKPVYLSNKNSNMFKGTPFENLFNSFKPKNSDNKD